jgi:predicted membrane channel-forming protein YqfA (hemolysin III family)
MSDTAAEPDLAMLANAELRDRGPRYTETPPDPYSADAPFIAEPWNAVTASFFVFIAAAWLWRLRGRYRESPFLVACLPILLAGGIGGTLYHGLRTERAYFLLDVIPIQLLALAGSVFIAIKLWKRRGWLYLVGAIAIYIGVSALLFNLLLPTSRQLAVNLNYAALATMVVLPIAIRLIATKFRHGSWFAAGLVAFAIAWFFRLVDERVGVYLPIGTHWLWHTFGAISTALVIEYFHRVESEPSPEPPA